MGGRLDWEAAARRDSVRGGPTPKVKRAAKAPSAAQERYIASLARQLGIPVPEGITTRSGAANTIADLKRRLERRERESG